MSAEGGQFVNESQRGTESLNLWRLLLCFRIGPAFSYFSLTGTSCQTLSGLEREQCNVGASGR